MNAQPTSTLPPARLALHRYSFLLTCVIVGLIGLGAHVKTTGSGLSVPDWPNTYGHFMFAFPWEDMVGGIRWEHTHRMVASIVGMMTFALTIWVWRVEPRRWVRILALWASGAVLAQGLLGGLTVLLLLPAWLSSSHGTLGQIYLSIVASIALVTSPAWVDDPQREQSRGPGGGVRRLALLTTCAIGVQLIVGAFMRHTEAGMAIPDIPTMFGSWIPPLSDARIAMANSELAKLGLLHKFGLSEITRTQILLQLAHRTWALVVAGMIFYTSWRIRRDHPALRSVNRNAAVLVGLVVVQVTLGILTILTERQPTITTMHVAVGAVTLMTSLLLTVRTRHLVAAPSTAGEPARAPVVREVPA